MKQVRSGKCNEVITENRTINFQEENIILSRGNMVVGFRLTERLKCDCQVCSRFLVAVCVTMFLEKREQILGSFTAEFQQLTLADEKTDLLDNFLHTLSVEMDKDPTWQGM